jgi:HD-like signal output (HDOD) protein
MSIQQDKIESFVKRIGQLPTLPTITTRLKTIINKPSSSAEDVAQLIEKDQSLSAKVLKTVNSAAYSPNSEITSIKHAVSMIGFNEINKMVLAISVFESLKGGGANGFNREGLWIHSLGCAVFSSNIAIELNYPKADDAFTAGLMHDIGIVVLDRFFQPEMAQIQTTLAGEPMLFYEAENKVMGFDHTLLGEWLLTNWKIPPSVCAAVRHHHQPFSQRKGTPEAQDLIVDIVHMADVICCNLEIGDSGNKAPNKFNDEHAQRISIDPDALEKVTARSQEQIEKDSSIFSG